MQKSWEGSLTMAAVSYVVSLVILWNVQGAMWQTLLVPVGIAIAATVLEAFSKLGVDNLTVPLGSAAIAFWLNQWSV
jgi:phytol kinase